MINLDSPLNALALLPSAPGAPQLAAVGGRNVLKLLVIGVDPGAADAVDADVDAAGIDGGARKPAGRGAGGGGRTPPKVRGERS
jgi:hypothetical protein